MAGLFTRLVVVASLAVVLCAMTASAAPSAKNHHLMTRLGLSKRPVSPSHYRKRLASESRGSNADSHMFVIKLPPNPYYYSHFKPGNHIHSVKKLTMGFRSNGKTSKIYHWNIPLLNKMAASRRPTSRLSDVDNDVISVKIVKPTSHTVVHSRHNVRKPSKQVYNVRKTNNKVKPALSIYSPAPTQSPKIYKYMSNNGKPQSFYVIDKSKKKPIKYQRLLT